MTDSSTDSSSQKLVVQKTSGPKRKTWRWILVLLVLIAAGGVYALHTCPWFVQMAGISTEATATLEVAALQKDVSDLHQRVAALEVQVNDLSKTTSLAAPVTETTPPPTTTGDATQLTKDVAALSSAVDDMKREVKQTGAVSAAAQDSVQNMAARIVSFLQLREAVQAGHVFTAELASCRTLNDTTMTLHDAFTKLDPYASKGVMTISDLREELKASEAEALHAVKKSEATRWWQRVLVELGSLVSIRPLHGDESSEAFQTVNAALAKGDVSAALDAFNAWPEALKHNLADWQMKLQARRDVEAAIQQLAAQLTTSKQATP
jgi:hypothetical protein